MMGYAEAANTARYLTGLAGAWIVINDYAQSEQALLAPLQASERMWNAAGTAIDGVLASFPTANGNLLAAWMSPADSGEYKLATEETQGALQTSRNSSAEVPKLLAQLIPIITQAAQASDTGRTAVDQGYKLLEDWKAANPLATQEQILAQDALITNQVRGPVVDAGFALNRLANWYTYTGSGIVAAGQGLRWLGPGSGNSVPTRGSRDAAPGGPGSTPNGGDMGPSGGPEAGTDQAGPEGGAGDAGGAPPGGETAPPGGETAPPGGPGLAGGPPTLPATVPPNLSTMPPNLPPSPPAGVPPLGTVPVGGLPVGGTTGGSTGGGRFGGGGGIGGSGKADFPKTGTTAQNLPTVGQQQIPRAGEQLSQPQPLSGGRPSPTTGGSGLAGNTSAGTGAGGIPPMMPPGGAGAAGAGGSRAGKPGSGTIRPVGRKRDRQQDETPGVPVGLRGKAGRDLPGAFPAAPAGSRRRYERDEADTLQLLDEDLWKVEETEVVAAPAPPRRLAN